MYVPDANDLVDSVEYQITTSDGSPTLETMILLTKVVLSES
jgi:hypothetical protein